MKKFNKQQQANYDCHCNSLKKAAEGVQDALIRLNQVVDTEWASVETAVENYNLTVQGGNQFLKDIQNEQEGFWEGCSEKWKDGDAGSTYAEWMDQWMLELDEIALNRPDPVDESAPEGTDQFQELTTSPAA